MLDPDKELFRWGPISACHLFMLYTINPSFAPMKKIFGHCYPDSVIIFKNNQVTWLLDLKNFTQAGKAFTQANILSTTKLNRYLNLWQKTTQKLNQQFEQLYQLQFNQLNNQQLVKTFKNFSQVYFDWWAHTMTVELATIILEPQLGQALKAYFSHQDEKNYNQAFAILTSPSSLTFYRQEQKELIKLLQLPEKSRPQALARHRQRYHWILNSYLRAKNLSSDYFSQELKQLETNKTDSLKLLREIQAYPAQIKKDTNQLLKKIKAKPDLKKLARLTSKFALLQDQRKALNFKADHFLELFVKEFAQRTKQPVSKLKYLLPDELAKSLSFIDHQLIKTRQLCTVFKCTADNITHLSGKPALTIHQQFKPVKKTKENMLHGQLASSGDQHYFRGPAKIILSIDQIDQIQPNDILITTMTSPDFVIGMKKAGAIITDEGGLLCHAAIVSRELKKPCIVGTRVATKVINDGDIVELHCWRGTVKIVKPSS